MKCRVCGVELKDTDRFCGICGTPNPNFTPAADPIPEPQSAPDRIQDVFSDDAAENREVSSKDANESSNDANGGSAVFGEISQEHTAEALDDQKPSEGETDAGVQASEIILQKEKGEEKAGGGIPQTAPGSIPPPTFAAMRSQPPAKPQKEKRVCSLSAVVICIIVILILSMLCGVLGGLYLSERNLRIRAEQGYSAQYSERGGGYYGQYRK